MFLRIAGFELRYQLRNPVFWVAAIVFLLLAFGAIASDNIRIGSGGNVHKNAPLAVAQIQQIFSIFFMFVSTAFVANVIVRDDETGFGPIVYSTRITKANYLLGRFTGAWLAAAIAFLAIPLGIWLGTMMPWVDREQLGPNSLALYFVPYLWLALPNLLLTASIFFAVATVTRSMMATYLGIIVFLVLWLFATIALARDPATRAIAAYVDPLGVSAFNKGTQYWTAAERNTLLPPFAGALLWNRCIALGLSVLALVSALLLFRFRTAAARVGRRKRNDGIAPTPVAVTLDLPAPRFDGATARAQLIARTRLEFAQVFRSPAYLVLLAIALFNSIGALANLGSLFGTPVWPVTRVIIELLKGSFGFVALIIAIYYGGELVWRERDRKTSEIIDASAIPDWAFVVPKMFALTLVLLSTLLMGVLAGVVVQLFYGYTHFEFAKYLSWYVVPTGIQLVLFAALSVFVQALSPHKFIGWGIMILFLISQIVFERLGLGDDLYNYGGAPSLPLSDMNGQGSFWIGAYFFQAYWASFALLLLVLSHALWRRGAETRLKPRLTRLPRRLRGPAGAIGGLALVAFIALGAWNYINTHVWNEYYTSLDVEAYRAAYEKALIGYASVPQPAVTQATVKVELWPHAPKLVASGVLSVVNRTDAPLTHVHVRMESRDTKFVALEIPGATLEQDEARFQYRIYRFDTPLAPGATTEIAFTTRREQRGFRQNGEDRRLVDNGTFLNNSEFVPSIGIARRAMLQERSRRRKYGLPPELRPAKLEDLEATAFNQLHSDWIKTDITIVTDADQTPIAPGNKVSDTSADGRRTARFVVEAPILNFYSIQSARFLEKHEDHNGVDLAVYYDAQHGRNVDRMLAAFGRGLDLYQPAFGPYQFKQARVIEFPAYATFAQAFAGTMPYSEGIGFIANLSDPEKIDYVTYVVAHELGHQWWAHQAIGADMQGGTVLVETLAQYSALRVMEQLYGRDQIRRFLKYELDLYLRGRGGEVIEELPLARVENQPYIHYRKGSLVMYRLKDALGAERTDAAMRRYLERFKFKSAPYPRSLDLIAEFRVGATPEEDALITDLFERIALYDVKTTGAKSRRLPDGRYETVLTVDARKFYVDGKGIETEAPLNETIEWGLFTAMPGRGRFATTDVLHLARAPVHSGVQTVTLVSDKRPVFAGADPYNLLIDRNSDDNVIATTE